MKKTKLTRSLLAAFSIVALTAVMYGCTHSSDNPPATEMEQTPAQQIAALQAQINTLRAELGLAPIDIDQLTGSVADLTQQVADLQKQVDDAQDAEDKMAAEAASKEALALFNSFSDTAGTTTDADMLTLASIAVTDTDDGGGSAKVAGTGTLTTGSTDGAGPGVSGDDVVRTAESMLGMWQGTVLTDTNTAGHSTMIAVYTDIEANTRKPWTEIYPNVDADTIADLRAANANAVIAAPGFSTGGLKDHHGDRALPSNVVSVSGTFDGAPGVYTCTSAAAGTCTSNLTAGGVVLDGTAWSFNPVDTAMVSQPDANYAHFGWWLNKSASGSPEVATFYGYTGTGTVDATTFNALGGSATYKGAAAGKYAMNRGADQYASGGHWTADATLTANFEADTVGAAGSISGMIDGFMAGGESKDWSVKLNSSDITIAAGAADFSTTATATATTVWTAGGAAAAAGGSWEGSFYNQTSTADGGNNVPATVAGEFTATYGAVGHMTGAFGANVEE